MRHIFLLDPLSQLNIRKDSSLMMALTLQKKAQVKILFLQDFFIHNNKKMEFKVYDFKGAFEKESFYLKHFSLTKQTSISLDSQDILHMRLDPPVDGRYVQVLWLLSFLQKKGIRVVNNPQSLLLYNEKLLAYTHKQSPSSLVSFSREKIIAETKKMYQAGQRYIILKPLDLFSGIGVTKITLKEKNKKWDESSFEKKLIILQKKFTGPLVLQSFLSQVYKGEVRALYFKGKELGSILKIPKAGKFLSNIAQGGTFHPCKLNKNQKKICDEISKQLFKEGILFVAFDVLGDLVTEVNITCPGLLVEVSQAYKRNLALEMNFN